MRGLRKAVLWAGRAHLRPAVVALAGGLVMLAAGAPARAGSQVSFPHPAVLEPAIQFWVDVFSAYSARDFIVVDRGDVHKVYQTLHLPGSGLPTREEVRWTDAYLKNKYRDILLRLAAGRAPAGPEERHVAALFEGQGTGAYARAADNLRVQEGLRERFREGLLRSRYYRPTMERIFRQFGLPIELVTLAQVESGFHPEARSAAGAVGIWQFTRATGRRFMRITRWRDERRDPIRSTKAAAQLLRYNYALLGDWPLAITAYNYGLGGTLRAAELSGHDFAKMLQSYNGRSFGFAVRNYYAEFLAALEVHRHEDRYFPGIQYEAPIAPDPVRAGHIIAHGRARHRYKALRKVSTPAVRRHKRRARHI